MTSENVDRHLPSQRVRDQEIDGRYGAIGIAAVAAAVRYQRPAEAKVSAPGYGGDDWQDPAA
jgi:hypothetical protein